MQHLEDGYLHAIADGEVPSDELVAVREHLDACESCRARLDEARHEAETARELIELIEVPDRTVGTVGTGGTGGTGATVGAVRHNHGARWLRPLAWAATVALAAGIGYYGRGAAPFATPAAEPLSIGRIDTVFLDVPAPGPQARPEEADQPRFRESVNRVAPPEAPSPRPEALPPARQNPAGARNEEQAEEKKRESKDATANLAEGPRERAASDAVDQRAQALARRPDQLAAAPPAAATAESRLMAKSGADAAPIMISFPRAVDLLGGRIKLIEGMVPARLEAVGRTVRVVYVIDEGDLVLSQVSVTDSLNWHLSGPLSADSLAALRRRVK